MTSKKAPVSRIFFKRKEWSRDEEAGGVGGEEKGRDPETRTEVSFRITRSEMTVKLHRKPASGTSDPEGWVVSETGCCPSSVRGGRLQRAAWLAGLTSALEAGAGASAALGPSAFTADANLPGEVEASAATPPRAGSGEGRAERPISSLQGESSSSAEQGNLGPGGCK